MANGQNTGLMATTAGTMTAATLAPTVNWALHGFPVAQMPDSTPLLIAAGGIVAAHALEKVLVNWWQKQTAPKPPAPGAPP